MYFMCSLFSLGRIMFIVCDCVLHNLRVIHGLYCWATPQPGPGWSHTASILMHTTLLFLFQCSECSDRRWISWLSYIWSTMWKWGPLSAFSEVVCFILSHCNHPFPHRRSWWCWSGSCWKFHLQVEHPYQFLLCYAKQLKDTAVLLRPFLDIWQVGCKKKSVCMKVNKKMSLLLTWFMSSVNWFQRLLWSQSLVWSLLQ